MYFDYKLDGVGWATATVGDIDGYVAMTASYLNDSLAQLAQATLALMAGDVEATVVFMAEPGEHHLVLSRAAEGGLAVQVRWFEDWASWAMHPADRYEVLFECFSTHREIKQQVIAALDRLLVEYGLEGYEEKWMEHEFPIAAFERLRLA